MLKIAKALEVLHSNSIIHGNIKLSNLMIKEEEGKLGDFSLSAFLHKRFIYAGNNIIYLFKENYFGESYN